MKRVKRLPLFWATLLLLAAIAAVTLVQPDNIPPEPPRFTAQPVTYITATPTAFRPVMTLIGTTTPRWFSEVRAPLGAKVTSISPQLEPGTLVARGEPLVQLDTSQLESQLAQATHQLKTAELELQQAQHEQTVALKMLAGKHSSAYARREPQLAAASAALTQARATDQFARQQLADAKLIAPFDALILSRAVSPGQFVEQGQALFELIASDAIDIQVPVSERQWQALSQALSQTLPQAQFPDQPDAEVMVRDRQQYRWPGTFRYLVPQADATSRQRQVVFSVSDPYRAQPRLLPRQQVNVDIRLNEHPAAFLLPSSALTRDNEVWSITTDNQLRREPVTRLQAGFQNPLHGESQGVWVAFAQRPAEPRRIVVYPLDSMLPGQAVMPVLSGRTNLKSPDAKTPDVDSPDIESPDLTETGLNNTDLANTDMERRP
ncbi:efflux RND transporter periplasmic adaptor subunit [Photobacterium sp. TY1-4]|uniref:efflux RND transporter periplasmic adaptor subunit n=1 Tax=Photobacterium sp. TY1-4 TaxID=2899122 RepID=UPI0021BF93BE|nr:efflux RND transporter periplasmic adaptor subunit [Photobacterium sp. TY1-4]UXI03583.1 efflux RND transporter periplasmic adaptor subunit [Photobacterium sp. TY1-4]